MDNEIIVKGINKRKQSNLLTSETNEDIEEESTENKEESNETESQEKDTETTKKRVRSFYAKEFLEGLHARGAYNVVKKFSDLCEIENAEQDYALEFLEAGGKLSHFLRIIEKAEIKNASYYLPIINAFCSVLLKIIAQAPNRHLEAEESCRELLSRHYGSLKSLMGINSSFKQRKLSLKLLTCMVALSATLAKDVLAHVTFENSSLGLLISPSKTAEGSVRQSFIHFLISFLIEGHAPTIITFLKKKGLLSCIFKNMIYDSPDIIELVFSTIKTRILEDLNIPKSIKMSAFTTQTIQNIVNIFNWKGPDNYKFHNNVLVRPVVNSEEKDRVCNIIYNFLLLLCTSKHGISFRDPLIGLDNKVCNMLLLTVLESLVKPWNFKYAYDLVVKICAWCPDLVKHVFLKVEDFLKPRPSQFWVNAVRFVKDIMESVAPKNLVPFLESMNVKQITLVFPAFYAPKSILTLLSSQILIDEHAGVRHEGNSLLLTILNSYEKYVETVNDLKTITTDNKNTIKKLTVQYLIKNLPEYSVILQDWTKTLSPKPLTPKTEEIITAKTKKKSKVSVTPEVTIAEPKTNSHLNQILDILFKYNSICPQLIENLMQNVETSVFLKTAEEFCSKQIDESLDMYVKAINLLISCNPTVCSPSKKLFIKSFAKIVNDYARIQVEPLHSEIKLVLFNICSQCKIFESSTDEIIIWFSSVLESEYKSDNIGSFLTKAFIKTNTNFLKYMNELASLKESTTVTSASKLSDLLQIIETDTNNEEFHYKTTHKLLSPLIIGVLDTLLEENEEEELKNYLNITFIHLLHSQTSPNILSTILLQEKYNKILDKDIINYYKNWSNRNSKISLKNIFDSNNLFNKLHKFLINNEENINNFSFREVEIWKDYYTIFVTNFIIFYYTQYSVKKLLTKKIHDNCLNLLLKLIEKFSKNTPDLLKCLDIILRHPFLLENFKTFEGDKNNDGLSNELVVKIIKELQNFMDKSQLENYLHPYRMKLLKNIFILLADCKKTSNGVDAPKLMEILNLLELNQQQCSKILEKIIELPLCCLSVEKKPSAVMKLINYCLKLPEVYKDIKPYSEKIMLKICNFLYQYISSKEEEINLEEFETNLYDYISHYPHTIINFDQNFFISMLDNPKITKSNVKLATLFLKTNKKLIINFFAKLQDIFEKRELVFSLMTVMDDESKNNKIYFEKIYKEYESIIKKYLNKPQKAPNYFVQNHEIVNKLINDFMSKDNCKIVCAKPHKFDVIETYHAKIVTTIFNKCILNENNEQKKLKFVTNFVSTLINMLTLVLKKSEKSEDDWNKVENISTLFITYLIKINNVYGIKYNVEIIYKSVLFHTFVKLCLKFGLQEKPILVNVLKQVCCLNEVHSTNLNIIFEMAISHSESLNILLSDDPRKAPLLSLLVTICKKCPSVVVKSHIPIWLASYEATLSPSDQYLLELLTIYEEANVGFHEYRPYLWGEVAIGHYSVRHGVETSLWRQPAPKEILDLFTQAKILNTIKYFPRTRQLRPTKSLYSDSDLEVYDPAFYLPLLSHLLAPGSMIRWFHCVSKGIISLVIIALSSECEEIRAAACHVLERFYYHLEFTSYAKQRLMWIRFVEFLCRGICSLDNLKPCSIVSIFLARCAIIFTKPSDYLYTTLGNYIVLKESPNFTTVPELLEMLHNSDVHFKAHRNFILEVIRDGLQTKDDLQVLFKSVAFKLLMSYYNSVLIDPEGKVLILEIIAAAVNIPKGEKILTNFNGLISWLNPVLKQITVNEPDLVIASINLLSNLSKNLWEIDCCVMLLTIPIINLIKEIKLDLTNMVTFIKTLQFLYNKKPILLYREQLKELLEKYCTVLNDKTCLYYLEYETDFVDNPVLNSSDEISQGIYYLKLFTLKWLRVNKGNDVE